LPPQVEAFKGEAEMDAVMKDVAARWHDCGKKMAIYIVMWYK
jgi:hypothetical protein